jgi:hypothetical protein
MNGLIRKLGSMGATGVLFLILAITIGAATAVAGSTTTADHGSDTGQAESQDNSGSGSSDDSGDDSGDDSSDDSTDDNGKSGDKGDSGADNGKSDDKGDKGNSEDHRRDGRGTLPHPVTPQQGKTLNIGKTKGVVKVRLPGARHTVTLRKDASVPIGSVLDARDGAVTVTTVPREDGVKQWATFSGATFQVLQPKTGLAITSIRLRGGNFASCGRPFANRSLAAGLFGPSAFASKRSKRKVRSLWGRGKGHFRTRGRNGAATVRGTIWLTEDRCDGTLVKVRRGVVDVRDFPKKKTFVVTAGHSHFARAKISRR